MLTLDWIELLRAHGGGKYSVKKRRRIRMRYISTMYFHDVDAGHVDYDLRIKNMDQAKVDIAVVSLTCQRILGRA